MPPMTTHCVLLLCGAGCLPVIASSYLRSGTKPPDKDVVNCPARAEPHSPQRGEHSNLDCDYLRVFRLHNQGNITDCSLLLCAVSSEVSHRIAAMVSHRMAHAWLAHSGYPQAKCNTSREAVDRFDACAIRRELKVPLVTFIVKRLCSKSYIEG